MTWKLISVEKIPAWLKNLPGDSLLSTKDVANALGFSGTGSVFDAEKNKRIPAREVEHKGTNGITRIYWRARTIRNEIRRRQKAGGE